METKNMIGKVVGITVALICVAVILMPIVSSYEESATKEFVNDDTYRMSPVGEDTIVFTYADGVYTVNDVVFTKENRPIFQNDTVMFYALGDNRAGFLYIITADGYNRHTIASTTAVTITYDGSAKTVTSESVVSGTTYSSTYEYTNEVYYADPEGDYVWLGSWAEGIYVDDDWPEFNCWSDGSTTFTSVMDGVVTVNGVVDSTATTSRTVETVETGYEGVYELTSYTVTIGDDTTSCRGYILPRIVTGNNPLVEQTSPLILTTPIMVIIAIVMLAVGFVTSRRD